MKNKIIFAIIILIIAVALFVFANKSEAPTAQLQINEDSQATSTATTIASSTPLVKDPKVKLELFQKYLSYNKSQNLDGVKSVVYKVSKVCDIAKPTDECKARMSAAYAHGVELKKEDFVNAWSDKRQTILTTDFWTESSEDIDLIGRFRSVIIFVRDENGVLKLLNFSPTKGGATGKSSASQQELNERIIRWSEDKDLDAIADYEEECLHKPTDKTCIKTNPKLRDTDGNGLWDGVDAIIRTF